MRDDNIKIVDSKPDPRPISLEVVRMIMKMKEKFMQSLGNSMRGNSFGPQYFHNHRSKTFLKNRRKQMKRR